MKVVAIGTVIVLTILAFATWSSYREHILPFPQSSPPESEPNVLDNKASSNSLTAFALSKVLDDAAPIFGHYSNVQTETSNWMAAYSDETWLVHMNLPGAHDAATWNYSATTQHHTTQITDLVNSGLQINNSYFRCQDSPLIDMLNAGIRVFDLRYAFDVMNSSIVFWHSIALLSETADLESVLFAFYKWLDDHPSEALFLSFQLEGVEAVGNVDNAEVQRHLFDILTTAVAQEYVRQTKGLLGTLGEARGRITLLRRFDLDKLPPEYEAEMPGLHFSPKQWTINGPNTKLVYNTTPRPDGETGNAFIQDLYLPHTTSNSSIAENVDEKMEKATAHFNRATQKEHRNDLFWHFLSSTNIEQDPPKTPQMMALGMKEVAGVNRRLLPVLREMTGKRLGIIMFDFFERPPELLPLFLRLSSLKDTKKMPDP